MVKRKPRTDRCFPPPEGNRVALVQFPLGPMHRRPPPPLQGLGRKCVTSGPGATDAEPGTTSSSTTTEEDRGHLGPDGGSRESKRTRLDGCDKAAALISGGKIQTSSGQQGDDGQQEAAELSEENRAAEVQSVGSLKVTIQQSSESREFGQTDRTADRQTGGLHCHVCSLTCRSLQEFQEHMSGSDHLKKLQEVTHSICLNAHTLQDRGRRPETRRWCDTCQTHFSGDVIAHRRTKQHKMCKQLCRPFCPVCKRHFRTPRKFVEHMKSAEHKRQVQLDQVQEEELITVDAVGCFEDEKEREEEEVDVDEEEEEEEEEGENMVALRTESSLSKLSASEETNSTEYDPHTTYGSGFVVPVSGFLCRICNKFFYKETTARQTHCRTHTHYLNLQRLRSRGTNSEPEGGAMATCPVQSGDGLKC